MSWVGPHLVVRSLHPGTAVTAAAPTDPGQRPLLVEEGDVGHLVHEAVVVIPAEPSAIARDCTRSAGY